MRQRRTTAIYVQRTASGAAGIGLGTTAKYFAQCFYVNPDLSSYVHKKNPHQNTFHFYSAAQNDIPI
jgi:hypothetical protein